jgi:hypothetical protein
LRIGHADFRCGLDAGLFAVASLADFFPAIGISISFWPTTALRGFLLCFLGFSAAAPAVHVAPTLTAGAIATVAGGSVAVPLDGGITVNDLDSGNTLTSATVSIVGLVNGDTLNYNNTVSDITGSYNAGTGVLASATVLGLLQEVLPGPMPIGVLLKNNRNGRCHGLCRLCRCASAVGQDHRDLALDQFGSKTRQPVGRPLRPPILDVHVPSFDEAGFLETFEETRNQGSAAIVNRHWNGTPDRHPKGTPLIGES